jgi:hypothetical protein
MNQIEPRTAETLKTNLGVSNSEPTAATLARALVDVNDVIRLQAPNNAISPRGINTGQNPANVSTDGNNSSPVITETYLSEIFVPANCIVTGIEIFNGSNVTGSVTVGLADALGNPIVAAQSASTAGSGTDAYQRIPFAAPYVAAGPATYFIQVQYSSATAHYNTHAVGKHATGKQTAQTYGTLTAFTPPTTFTTAIGNIAGLY